MSIYRDRFKILYQRYRRIVLLVILLVGLLLVSAPILVLPSGNVFGIAVVTVGVTITATTLIALLQSIMGTDYATVLSEALDASQRASMLGLESLHLVARDDERFFSRFADARSIDLLYNTAKSTITGRSSAIAKAINERGCQVRFIISDPTSPLWQNRDIVDGLCPGTHIDMEIGEVKAHVKYMIEHLLDQEKPPSSGCIELRFSPCAPTSSIVILDEKFVRHTPYLPYEHSGQVPSYEVVRSRGGQLFKAYADAFERTWRRSRPVLKKDFSTGEQVGLE